MFSKIEKEYKKGLQQKRFIAYYWPCAALVAIITIIFALIFESLHWIIYGCAVVIFLILVAVFFVWELHNAKNTFRSVRDSKGIISKLLAYFAADDEKRLNNLVSDLASNNICTKDDLKLALDYFQSRLPIVTRVGLVSWILTAVIMLTSVIIVAYDEAIGTINIRHLIPAFGSAVVVALIILTPIIIAKIISVSISNSRSKVDTILVEDLAYIYVHFDQYQSQLNSNNPNKRHSNGCGTI